MPERVEDGVNYRGHIFVVTVRNFEGRGFLDLFEIRQNMGGISGNSLVTRFTLPEEAAAIFGSYAKAAASAEMRAKLWIDGQL